MILTRSLLVLFLGIIALLNTGQANPFEASDEQTCMDLCRKCNGATNFEDNVCQCHVADDNQRGAECIGRLKRQAGDLGLDIVSCDLADPDADRAARCIVSPPFRRFRSRSDADLIAKYFMGGLGGLLGSSKSKTGEPTLGKEESDASSPAENVAAKRQSSGNNLDSDSDLVGAPKMLNGANLMSGQMTGSSPLLEAAAAWLNPQTLLGIRNGLQGVGTNYVGQPGPGSMSSSTNHNQEMDTMQNNFVGSSQQDIGNSPSMGTPGFYNPYPAGTMVGMSPYSYFVGAPNPVELQDGSQGSPMTPYLYNYNSMLGAQNPSFMGGDLTGISPYGYYPTPLIGTGNPQPGDTAGLGSSMDESAKAAEDQGPNSDPSLGAKKDTEVDELGTTSNEIEEPVVSSKQTDQNLKEDLVNPEEVKVQARDTSNYSTKRRQNRFRSRAGSAKAESTIEN